MNYAQFKRWLEKKRKELAYYGGYYEDYCIKNHVAATIAIEASKLAVELRLPELMREWDERAEVLEVDQYLVECLAAIPEPKDKGVYSLEEAGQRLGVSRRTVSRLIDAGELECTRIGCRVTVTSKQLANYQESEETESLFG